MTQDQSRSDSLRRFAAFTNDPAGGNPAGVWVGKQLPDESTMQAIAADVGYSETVFATPAGERRFTARYFSPEAEVPFCGHATIALGARLAGDVGPGQYVLATQVGDIQLSAQADGDNFRATLTSVEPTSHAAEPALVATALSLLDWSGSELDPSIPPAVAFGGAHHLVLSVKTRSRLADMAYDFDAMTALMQSHDLTTVNLIWRESANIFHSRNLFPVGGVVEDPATGAAAAALGGYLRSIAALAAPASITIHQGDDMGRASLLRVAIPKAGGISVSGSAVAISTD